MDSGVQKKLTKVKKKQRKKLKLIPAIAIFSGSLLGSLILIESSARYLPAFTANDNERSDVIRANNGSQENKEKSEGRLLGSSLQSPQLASVPVDFQKLGQLLSEAESNPADRNAVREVATNREGLQEISGNETAGSEQNTQKTSEQEPVLESDASAVPSSKSKPPAKTSSETTPAPKPKSPVKPSPKTKPGTVAPTDPKPSPSTTTAPAPTTSTPKPSPTPQPTPTSKPRSVDDPTAWAELAFCESSNRATVISPNGLYHGLYQFSVSSWEWVGGTGLPSQATPEEQLKRAKMLFARQASLGKHGWDAWPRCSEKLKLKGE